MRVAVVHEWFVDWAGSEKVVEQIVACYPDADLFALVDFLPADRRAQLLDKRAKTTFLQRMPFSRTRLPWYLPLMPIAIEQLDLSSYDLIISSSHAVAKGVLIGPDQTHISYVHSPMRYAWDMQHDYLRGSLGKGLRGIALRSLLHYLRMWDVRTAYGVDAFIANSSFVARRIAKTYGRQADVVHPPVDIERFEVTRTKEEFYVCIARMMPYKRVDLVMEAFRSMPSKRVLIFGYGPELKTYKRVAPSNVEFLGYQSDLVVRDVLQRARALIFAGKEDFGIVSVEAQACGTPVIAYAQGGFAETVLPLGSPTPTGVLFEHQTSAALADAVDTFERNFDAFDPSSCRRNAERFSARQFREKFQILVNQQLAKPARRPDSH